MSLIFGQWPSSILSKCIFRPRQLASWSRWFRRRGSRRSVPHQPPRQWQRQPRLPPPLQQPSQEDPLHIQPLLPPQLRLRPQWPHRQRFPPPREWLLSWRWIRTSGQQNEPTNTSWHGGMNTSPQTIEQALRTTATKGFQCEHDSVLISSERVHQSNQAPQIAIGNMHIQRTVKVCRRREAKSVFKPQTVLSRIRAIHSASARPIAILVTTPR